MRLFFSVMAACGMSLLAGADDKKPDAATEMKALVGEWKIEKAVIGGKDVLEQVKTMKFEIKAGGKYTVKIGELVDEGSFTVDTTKTPAEMDIKSTEGPNKGKTIKAIYKLDGDGVTICYEMGEGDRPKKFESSPDTMLFLAEYKRKK